MLASRDPSTSRAMLLDRRSPVSMRGYGLVSVDMTAGKASSSEGTSIGEFEIYLVYRVKALCIVGTQFFVGN